MTPTMVRHSPFAGRPTRRRNFDAQPLHNNSFGLSVAPILMACGASGPDGPGSDTLASRISAGTQAEATQFAGVAVRRSNTDPEVSERGTVAVTFWRPDAVDVPSVIVEAFGERHSFLASDYVEDESYYELRPGDNEPLLFFFTSHENGWLGVIDEEPDARAEGHVFRYMAPAALYSYAGDSFPGKYDFNWHSVIGLETDARHFPSGTASFTGTADMRVYTQVSDGGDWQSSDGDEWLYATDQSLNAHLQANFAAGTVSGGLGDWSQERVAARVGDLEFSDVPLDSNGFSSSLFFADAPAGAVLSNSSMEGTFYGPTGEEAGGIVSFHVEDAEGAISAHGTWRTARTEPESGG